MGSSSSPLTNQLQVFMLFIEDFPNPITYKTATPSKPMEIS